MCSWSIYSCHNVCVCIRSRTILTSVRWLSDVLFVTQCSEKSWQGLNIAFSWFGQITKVYLQRFSGINSSIVYCSIVTVFGYNHGNVLALFLQSKSYPGPNNPFSNTVNHSCFQSLFISQGEQWQLQAFAWPVHQVITWMEITGYWACYGVRE